MLDWLESNLAQAANTDRKFIITDHVYSGARFLNEKMRDNNKNERFFQIVRDNAPQIAIEVAGHEHITDFRYHASHNVLDFDDPKEEFFFHNIFIAPGVIPWYRQNPGVSMFEISDDGTPHSLKMEFIDMMSFKGRTSIKYEDLTFRSLDLAADYGLKELTPQGLRHFRHFLEDPSNFDTAISFLISKMGFDPSDPDEA